MSIEISSYQEGLFQKACKLLKKRKLTRRELALAIPCGYDALYYDVITRLIHEEPEIYKQIDDDAGRVRIIELAIEQEEKQGWYDVKEIARETFYAPHWIQNFIKEWKSQEPVEREDYLEKIEQLDWEKCCGAPPERDLEWLDWTRQNGGLGFEFTGEYWKRYREIWELKRRGEDGRRAFMPEVCKPGFDSFKEWFAEHRNDCPHTPIMKLADMFQVSYQTIYKWAQTLGGFGFSNRGFQYAVERAVQVLESTDNIMRSNIPKVARFSDRMLDRVLNKVGETRPDLIAKVLRRKDCNAFRCSEKDSGSSDGVPILSTSDNSASAASDSDDKALVTQEPLCFEI